LGGQGVFIENKPSTSFPTLHPGIPLRQRQAVAPGGSNVGLSLIHCSRKEKGFMEVHHGGSGCMLKVVMIKKGILVSMDRYWSGTVALDSLFVHNQAAILLSIYFRIRQVHIKSSFLLKE